MGIDPKAKAVSLFDEFKNFAFKGNIVDLTVGFIIGAGFTAVVKSMVDNVIMPIIAMALPSKKGFEGMVWVVNGSTIKYGLVIADLLVFVATALVVFIMIVKFLGWVMRSKKKDEVAPPPPPAPTKEEILLTEIRDAIRAKP